MNNQIMFDRLLKMYEMAIWDNEGSDVYAYSWI